MDFSEPPGYIPALDYYFGWLVSPVLNILSATATILSYDENMSVFWLAIIGWNVGTAYFSLMWFHEHTVGGPLEEDYIFSNYRLTAWIGYAVTAIMSLFATVMDANPTAFAANFFASAFGSFIVLRQTVLFHMPEEEEDLL